jgi:hypothetical protein
MHVKINTKALMRTQHISTYFPALIMQGLSRNNQRISKKNNRKWFGIFTRNFDTTVVYLAKKQCRNSKAFHKKTKSTM